MNRAGTIFLKGLAVVVPLVATLWILWWLGASAEAYLGAALRWSLPEHGLLKYRPGMGVVAGVIVVLLIGVLSHWVLFRRAISLLEALLERVPLVKSLYGGIKDMMGFMSKAADGDESSLGQPVGVDLGGDVHLIGFVTESNAADLPQGLGEGDDRVAVYIPMSYQLGGFTIVVRSRQITRLAMGGEQAMRYVLTAATGTRLADSPDSARGEPSDPTSETIPSNNESS